MDGRPWRMWTNLLRPYNMLRAKLASSWIPLLLQVRLGVMEAANILAMRNEWKARSRILQMKIQCPGEIVGSDCRRS